MFAPYEGFLTSCTKVLHHYIKVFSPGKITDLKAHIIKNKMANEQIKQTALFNFKYKALYQICVQKYNTAFTRVLDGRYLVYVWAGCTTFYSAISFPVVKNKPQISIKIYLEYICGIARWQHLMCVATCDGKIKKLSPLW